MAELSTTSLASDANLVSYYRMEGNSNDSKGTFNGVDTSMSYQTSTGKYTQGGSVNGTLTNSGIVCGTGCGANLFASGGALAGWIYPKSIGTAGNSYIFSKTDLLVGLGWVCLLNGTASGSVGLRFNDWFSNTDGAIFDTPKNIILNQWNHIAVNYNSSNTANVPTIYINNVSVTVTVSGSPTGTLTSDKAQSMTLGNQSTGSRTFDGYLDDMALFNRTLTAGEIGTLYNAPASGMVYFRNLMGVGF